MPELDRQANFHFAREVPGKDRIGRQPPAIAGRDPEAQRPLARCCGLPANLEEDVVEIADKEIKDQPEGKRDVGILKAHGRGGKAEAEQGGDDDRPLYGDIHGKGTGPLCGRGELQVKLGPLRRDEDAHHLVEALLLRHAGAAAAGGLDVHLPDGGGGLSGHAPDLRRGR